MALIIKGDMPKGCNTKDKQRCPIWSSCKYQLKGDTMSDRPSGCSILGEIPDEHGDLIDKQKLYELAVAPYGNFYGFEGLIRDLKNAPVIVPSTDSK